MKKNRICSYFLFLFFIPLMTSLSWADLNLSANANVGGSTINFGRVDYSRETNQEVRLRVSSNDGQQYQVYQRLMEPLVNEKGMSLSRGVIETYSLSGSNASGTIYLQSPVALSQAEELIYSSSTGGESYSLTLVYTVKPDQLDVSGTFQGRILYTVRSVSGGQRDEVVLNMTLDASGELKVSLEGVNNRTQIKLKSSDLVENQAVVKFSYSGNGDGKIKVYQELAQLPENALMEEIGREVVGFDVRSNNGSASSKNQLEKRRVLVYESDDSQDDVYFAYQLDQQKTLEQKSGNYKSRVKYIVETSRQTKEFDLDLEVDIAAQFNLDVKFPDMGLNFDNVLPDAPPQFRTVEVKVITNLGKPYSVAQNVQATLTNEKGEEIPKKHFTVKVEMVGGSQGRILASDFKSVEKGDAPLVLSNSSGESMSFNVIYQLSSYPGMVPGQYQAAIVYSLEQN